MGRREYEIVLAPEAEGGYSVFVPDLPSVVTQGETVPEAIAMAKEAIELYLKAMEEDGLPIPSVQRERVAVGGLATQPSPVAKRANEPLLLSPSA